MSPYLRTVKTSSGATAVQIVHSSRRGSRDIEHIGSAHDDVELELLQAAARQRLAAGQGVLDLGLDTGVPGGPLPISSSRMGHPGQDIPDGHIFTQPWPPVRTADATRSSTTSTRPTAPGGRCAASMSRSPRLRKRSQARSR